MTRDTSYSLRGHNYPPIRESMLVYDVIPANPEIFRGDWHRLNRKEQAITGINLRLVAVVSLANARHLTERGNHTRAVQIAQQGLAFAKSASRVGW